MIAPLDGALTLGADLSSWTTLTPATITAVNTGPATLSITRAANWETSPAGAPATTFDFTASATGVNLGTLTGSPLLKSLNLPIIGVNVVSVALTASAPTPFPAGSYVGQVTVTCVTQ